VSAINLTFLLIVLVHQHSLASEISPRRCADVFSPVLMLNRPVTIPDSYELPNGRKHSKYKKFISEISELRDKINLLTEGKLNQVESVIYPAAGFDSGYPFLMAPKAKVVIALDDNPFITQKNFKLETSLKPVQPYGYASYMHFSAIVSLPGLANQIVANIKGLDKNIRIRSVEAFMIQGESKYMEAQDEHIPIHGLVKFDRGDGTPEQIYIHVNRFFSSLEPSTVTILQSSWWSGMISSRRMALLYKGAAGITGESTIDALEQIFAKTPGSVYVAAKNEATVRFLSRSDHVLVPLEESKRGYKEVLMPYFQDPKLKKYKVRARLGYNSIGGRKGWVDIVIVPENSDIFE